jgi:membrane-associated phospholipid phosphatase
MPLVAAVLAALVAALLTVGAMALVRGPAHMTAVQAAEAAGLRDLVRRRLGLMRVSGAAFAVGIVVVGLGLLAVGFGAVAATRTALWSIDAGPAAWGGREATSGSTAALRLITWLGGTAVVVPLALAAGIWDWVHRRRADGLLFLVVVVAGQNLIANVVKVLLDRPRPPVPEQLAAASGFSFPSGHTTAAAATYAALALLLARGRSWPVRAALGAGAAAVIALVGASRVLLAVHWMTDVLAGAAVGLAWWAVCALLFGGTRLRLGAELESADPDPGGRGRVAAPQPDDEGGRPMSENAPIEPSTGTSSDGPPSELPVDGPSEDQVESRAESLQAEPGNRGHDTRRQAEALLAESEARVDDPATRDPENDGVIRRESDEGVETQP